MTEKLTAKRRARLVPLLQSGKLDEVIAQLKQAQQSPLGAALEVDKDGNYKIVSVFFGMDVSIGSPMEYYGPEELEEARAIAI